VQTQLRVGAAPLYEHLTLVGLMTDPTVVLIAARVVVCQSCSDFMTPQILCVWCLHTHGLLRMGDINVLHYTTVFQYTRMKSQ
jgi:hypothetical protein